MRKISICPTKPTSQTVLLVDNDNPAELCAYTLCNIDTAREKDCIVISTDIFNDFYIDKFIYHLISNLLPENIYTHERFTEMLYDVYKLREFLYRVIDKFVWTDPEFCKYEGAVEEVRLIRDCLILYYCFEYNYDYDLDYTNVFELIEEIIQKNAQ